MSHAESLKLSLEITASERAELYLQEIKDLNQRYKETFDENTNLKASIERGEVWVDGTLYRTQYVQGINKPTP